MIKNKSLLNLSSIIGCLVVGQTLYFGVLFGIDSYHAFYFFSLSAPIVAGLIGSYLWSCSVLLQSAAVGVLGSIIGIAFSFVYEYCGFKIDVIGTLFQTFIILFVYQFFLGLVGCILGRVTLKLKD